MAGDNSATRRQLHSQTDQDARRAHHTWLRHPAVPRVISLHAVNALATVDPLRRLFTRQYTVTLFVAKALEFRGQTPDGLRWPDPLAPVPTEDERIIWPEELPVTAAERALWLSQVGPELAARLRIVALELAAEGVPLDPNARSELLLVGQLLFARVDWKDPKLIDKLNIVALGGWRAADAQHLEVSRLADAKAEGRLNAIQRLERERLGLGHIAAPYAGGGQREERADAKAMREAVAIVLDAHPHCTPKEIQVSWRKAIEPGALLRKLLEERLGAKAPKDPPKESTLYRYFAASRP